MWDLPGPGLEPMPPALAGGYLTTGTPGMSQSSIFSDHYAIRLDITYRKNTVKNTNTWRINNTLLNNQEITEENQRGNQKIPKMNTGIPG